jgi:hypothetical protein
MLMMMIMIINQPSLGNFLISRLFSLLNISHHCLARIKILIALKALKKNKREEIQCSEIVMIELGLWMPLYL